MLLVTLLYTCCVLIFDSVVKKFSHHHTILFFCIQCVVHIKVVSEDFKGRQKIIKIMLVMYNTYFKLELCTENIYLVLASLY